MAYYVVTATLNGHTNAHTIEASNSFDATMDAIFYIADLAYADKQGSWAMGEIKLIDPTGTVIHHAPAKPFTK